MIKSRSGWPFIALAFALVLPAMGQQPRQTDVAAAAKIYGYNLTEGNWIYSPAHCDAMPGVVLLHYHRSYPDGAESNFTALVPRSMGRVRIVPVLYHGATPFVPASKNPRNFALFNSLTEPVTIGSKQEKRWLERASCYAEMTGGNDFLGALGAGPAIASQPSPTVRVTVQGKTAHVLFAERDSYHTYRLWELLFNREGKIKSAQTQEESVYATGIARSTVPMQHPKTTSEAAAAQSMRSQTGEIVKESASRPAPLSTSQPQQRASIEPNQPAPSAAPIATLSTSPASEPQITQPAQPGWKLVLNPARPPAKFIPNAPPPPSKSIPNPSGDQK